MKLLDRCTIITGANQGLGFHVARHFVREGAQVLICARGDALLDKARADLVAHAGDATRVIAMTADVSREADCRAMVARAQAEFGRVDVLVNCAGVAGPRGPFEENDWADWARAVEINLLGTALPCALVLADMKRRKSGKIINLSGGGATKPTPHLSAYAASKAAVVRLTETLAVELREYGVDVNAVAPGVLATKVVDEFLDVDGGILGRAYLEEVKRQRENSQPAFDQAASLCVFLASAESNGITGRLLSAVWDPWKDLPKRRDELAQSDIYTLRRVVPEDRGRKWAPAP